MQQTFSFTPFTPIRNAPASDTIEASDCFSQDFSLNRNNCKELSAHDLAPVQEEQ